MDLVPEGERIVAEEEEDRISKLPEDIIHRILSFLDMKYAVQTSAVSCKWKHIWTSMPYLNLNSQVYPTLPHFAKFVKQALSHRNNHTNLTAVDLKFTGLATQFAVESTVNYAYSHDISQMNIVWFTKRSHEFPQFLLSSHTLKHLTVAVKYPYFSCVYGTRFYPEKIWDFPALETLNLSGVPFGCYGEKNINLFSKSVNLKDLTLDRCSMKGFGIVTICCPQLSNLTITKFCSYPEVFKVVAPQLENLTASISNRCKCGDVNFLQLSVEAFNSLEKVNLRDSNYHVHKERGFPRLLYLFQNLSFVKVLTLDMDIVETLSSNLDQLSHEPCPFNNLKCLKINPPPRMRTGPIPTIPSEVREYLLDNSPNATCNLNSPQLSRNRPRQKLHDDTMANKVAKLEEKLQNRDEVIIEQKQKIQMLEAAKLQHENFMSCLIKSKMAGLKVQVERGNPDYEVIRSVGHNIKSVMDMIPESLRVDIGAQFSSQYQELKCLLLTCIDTSQWAKIENELGIIRDSEGSCCYKSCVQSDVSAAEPSRARSPSSTNIATSSKVAL